MNEQTIEILKTGSLSDVKQISQNLKNMDSESNALHYATANKDIKVIQYLVDELHLDPFKIWDDNTSVLHQTAYYGNIDAIQFFLEKGVDHSIEDEYGFNMMNILEKKKLSHLIPLVQKMILAHQNNYSACYKLATLYLLGNNAYLKADLNLSLYYINKALLDKNITVDKVELLNTLKNKIMDKFEEVKILKENNIKTDFTDMSIVKDNENKPMTSSFTSFLKKVTHSFTNKSSKNEDRQMLIKKVQ